MISKWLIGGLCLIATACERQAAQPVQEQVNRAAQMPLAVLQVPYVSHKIAINGHLDEAAWKSAPATAQFVNTMQGSPCLPRTTSRWLWNEHFLFVTFEVDDRFLKSTFQNRDDHLWEQDTVEILFDPKGDGANYYEIQVSPSGNVFDTRFDRRREPRPFGHVTWSSQADVGVAVLGKVNDDHADNGYRVEIALPWSAFDIGDARPQTLAFRANMFILDALTEGGQRACGWSPPLLPDFHITERFGHLHLMPPRSTDAVPKPRASGD